MITTFQVILLGFSIGVGVLVAAIGWTFIPFGGKKAKTSQEKVIEQTQELIDLRHEQNRILRHIGVSLCAMAFTAENAGKQKGAK